jgi:hypothetical protein
VRVHSGPGDFSLLVDNQVENDLDSSVMASLDQGHAVIQRTIRLMNVLVVADIVTHVDLRRLVVRVEPAEPGQVN